jgi:hypothetical protein
MSIVQSIENARQEHVGPHGIGADALKSVWHGQKARLIGFAPAMRTVVCRCCACLRRTAIWRRSGTLRASSRTGQPISLSLAPAAPAWADRPWRNLRVSQYRVSAHYARRRNCTSSTILTPTVSKPCLPGFRTRRRALSRSPNPAAPRKP